MSMVIYLALFAVIFVVSILVMPWWIATVVSGGGAFLIFVIGQTYWPRTSGRSSTK